MSGTCPEKIFTTTLRKIITLLRCVKPELLRERINLLNTVDPYIGRYSTDWVKKNVLQMSDDEIELMNKEMQHEGPVVTQPEVMVKRV